MATVRQICRVGRWHLPLSQRTPHRPEGPAGADAGRHHRTTPTIAYDRSLYASYEHSCAIDTAKKNLEAMTALVGLEGGRSRRSLDIGAATCRYPRLLGALGWSSFGIDLASSGYTYVRDLGSPFRGFALAAGDTLPFPDDTFDLVTIMMGTLNHVPAPARARVLAECERVLTAGGKVVASIWDTASRHQSFLSFYSEQERARFRRNACDLDHLRALVGSTRRLGGTYSRVCFGNDDRILATAPLAYRPADLRAFARRDAWHGDEVGDTSQIIVAVLTKSGARRLA